MAREMNEIRVNERRLVAGLVALQGIEPWFDG
jgi:hypothetical protein